MKEKKIDLQIIIISRMETLTFIGYFYRPKVSPKTKENKKYT